MVVRVYKKHNNITLCLVRKSSYDSNRPNYHSFKVFLNGVYDFRLGRLNHTNSFAVEQLGL